MATIEQLTDAGWKPAHNVPESQAAQTIRELREANPTTTFQIQEEK